MHSLESIAHGLRTCNLDDQEIAGIFEGISRFTEWCECCGNQYLAALVKIVHAHSWFCYQGIRHIAHSRRGTSAGTAPADVIFLVAVSRVLKRIRTRLIADQPVPINISVPR